jgi:RNA polymerase sigma-70 factor (ECF subfamily)
MSEDSDKALPDEILISRIITRSEGSERAMRVLVDRYIGRAHAWALRIAIAPHDAEDIAWEALYKALVAVCAGRYEHRGEHSFAAWLHRIVVHTAFDHKKKWAREPATGLALRANVDALRRRAETGTPEEKVDLRQQADRALAKLSPAQRDAVLAYGVRGFCPDDPKQLNSLRVNYHKGIKRFAAEFEGFATNAGEIHRKVQVQPCPSTQHNPTSWRGDRARRGTLAEMPSSESSKTAPPSQRSYAASTSETATLRSVPSGESASSKESAARSTQARSLLPDPARIRNVIAATVRLEDQAKRSAMKRTFDPVALQQNIISQLKVDSECSRLSDLFEVMPSGVAREELLSTTLDAMHELWSELNRRPDAPTPYAELDRRVHRAANRILDVRKRWHPDLAAVNEAALCKIVLALLQGLWRSAAQIDDDDDCALEMMVRSEPATQDAMTANRVAFMRYSVRRGKPFTIEHIAATLTLKLAEARQRKRRANFSDEDIGKLLGGLPVPAVQSLWTATPSPAALNQLLKHTGYLDAALQRDKDSVSKEPAAAAAHTADATRLSKADFATVVVDSQFKELEAKFRRSKENADD